MMMVCMLALSLFGSPGIRMLLIWHSLFLLYVWCQASVIHHGPRGRDCLRVVTRTSSRPHSVDETRGRAPTTLSRVILRARRCCYDCRKGGGDRTLEVGLIPAMVPILSQMHTLFFSATQNLGVRGSIDLLGSSLWFACYGALHPQRYGCPR